MMDREILTTTSEEFRAWSHERVRSVIGDKALILSPGGSSRWYFMEHGNPQDGYLNAEEFSRYSKITLEVVLNIAQMMFMDGVNTVYSIAFTPQFDKRDDKYLKMMAYGLTLMASPEILEIYQKYDMKVSFRGTWETALAHYGSTSVYNQFTDITSRTQNNTGGHLVWCIQDKPIPDSLIPVVQRSLNETHQMPEHETLARAYYGSDFIQPDIFIGNNKPSIGGQLPPFLMPSDLYFTVSPTLYLNQNSWRDILHDHLFARRVAYRDYQEMNPSAFDELRNFYREHRMDIMGVGKFDNVTQTWRSTLL